MLDGVFVYTLVCRVVVIVCYNMQLTIVRDTICHSIHVSLHVTVNILISFLCTKDLLYNVCVKKIYSCRILINKI